MYEGIATVPLFLQACFEFKEDLIDLMYEGIATNQGNLRIFKKQLRLNWPDVRRDCDFHYNQDFIAVARLNWPDVRRDCDAEVAGQCVGTGAT